MKIAALLAAALIAAAPSVTYAAPASHADGASDALPAMPPPAGAPPPVAPASTPREKGRWYGWELILSDTLFLLLADDRGHETGLGSAGLPIALVGLAAAPPALHLIHGNARRAGFGLLVRGVTVGLYAATVLTQQQGSNSCNGQDGGCVDISDSDIAMFGLTLIALGGAITYVIIDDFFFSRVPVAAPPQPRATVVPTAYLRPGGGGLGLAGTF